MRFAVGLLILGLSLFSCREKGRKLHVFFPENYVGETELHFGVDSAKNHMIASKDDMYMIFLTGKDLSKIQIKEKNMPGGPYDVYFYYYSTDTLYQLSSISIRKDDIVNKQYVGSWNGTSGSYGSIQYFSVTKNSK